MIFFENSDVYLNQNLASSLRVVIKLCYYIISIGFSSLSLLF